MTMPEFLVQYEEKISQYAENVSELNKILHRSTAQCPDWYWARRWARFQVLLDQKNR